jgi:hypothetical protein
MLLSLVVAGGVESMRRLASLRREGRRHECDQLLVLVAKGGAGKESLQFQ